MRRPVSCVASTARLAVSVAIAKTMLRVLGCYYYLGQMNGVNGGDNVFIGCACVGVCVRCGMSSSLVAVIGRSRLYQIMTSLRHQHQR